jgi:hypothetical protein
MGKVIHMLQKIFTELFAFVVRFKSWVISLDGLDDRGMSCSLDFLQRKATLLSFPKLEVLLQPD